MVLITLKMALLLGSIVMPLSAKKHKPAKSFKIDTDTSNAQYAVNEDGLHEKIHRSSLQVEDTE